MIPLDSALQYIAYWGTIGSIVFTGMVYVLFWTDLVYVAREEDGKLKRNMPLRGYLAMSIIPLSIIYLHIHGWRSSLEQYALGFNELLLVNYGLYLFLFLYDTLIIDILVLCLWRPSFIKLPNMERNECIRHHLWTFPIGTGLGIIPTLISTSLIWFLWR